MFMRADTTTPDTDCHGRIPDRAIPRSRAAGRGPGGDDANAGANAAVPNAAGRAFAA